MTLKGGEIIMITKKDEQDIDDSLAATENNALALSDIADVGTEEMGQEDMNTPILKIIQPGTQDIEDKKEGQYYRSDTKETVDNPLVNLVYVSTLEVENFNKTGIEKVKVYYGFYEGTNEPFKMFVRGWGLAGHRDFQSEVGMIKGKYKIPMLALKVSLSTEKQQGKIPDTGKQYTSYKLQCKIAKDSANKPVVESDPERIAFLVEAVQRFKQAALVTSVNDDKANEVEQPPFH